MPRLLSDCSDAPLLGEAAILWLLTIQPEKGFAVQSGGSIPIYAWVVMLGLFLFGAWRVLAALWAFRDALHPPEPAVWAPKFQVVAWVCLLAGSVAAFWFGTGVLGVILLIIAAMLPMVKRNKAPQTFEEWPEAKASAAKS